MVFRNLVGKITFCVLCTMSYIYNDLRSNQHLLAQEIRYYILQKLVQQHTRSLGSPFGGLQEIQKTVCNLVLSYRT